MGEIDGGSNGVQLEVFRDSQGPSRGCIWMSQGVQLEVFREPQGGAVGGFWWA